MNIDLGQIVATPGALKAINSADISDSLMKHKNGDWGVLSAEDKKANDEAANPATQERILSSYVDKFGNKFWIITEWDRSFTTVLLPEEY